MNQVRETGSYKANITDYGLIEATKNDSKSVGVTLKAELYEQWRPDEAGGHWEPCNYEAEGVIWVVKKDGDTNEPAVESLVNHAGWDASLLSVGDESWRPNKCQVVVKSNTFEGKTKLQIAFVNSLARTPSGGMSNISKERVKELQQKFGDKLKTHAGTTIATPPAQDADIPF